MKRNEPGRTPSLRPGLHSRPGDAARIARMAAVKRLALIHASPAGRERKVKAARRIFPETFWPADGESVVVDARQLH